MVTFRYVIVPHVNVLLSFVHVINLYDGQMQGVTANIEKTMRLLLELKLKLIARSTGEVKKGKSKYIYSMVFLHTVFVAF